MPPAKFRDKSPHIIISGATGLIGRALYKRLRPKGYRITIISRDPSRSAALFPDAEGHLEWTREIGRKMMCTIDGADAIIHLAGKSLAGGRWTDNFKHEVRESRIQSTRALAKAIRESSKAPAVFITASAVGYYGNTGDELVNEGRGPGNDFLAALCKSWEEESRNVNTKNTRVVNIRTGLVLAPNGGTLKKMLPAFKLGLGAWFGSGKQWFPWIHIEDVCGIIERALENKRMEGAFNATAPGIVTNKNFSKMLGQALHRPVLLPVPGWVLNILFGEFAAALLGGQRAEPAKAIENGYVFAFPKLDSALTDLLDIP
jgi:uncharacterized protein